MRVGLRVGLSVMVRVGVILRVVSDDYDLNYEYFRWGSKVFLGGLGVVRLG